MKAWVRLETMIEPHDLVYYLGLEPLCHDRKAKVLPLDHYCLMQWRSQDLEIGLNKGGTVPQVFSRFLPYFVKNTKIA